MPKDLKEIAPGASLPFIIFNGEVVTDLMKIEDFLEIELSPPKYPSLTCQFAESTIAWSNIFTKFSAWIKDKSGTNKFINDGFYNSLKKLNRFLNTPLTDEDEIDADGCSLRKYLDGNRMTLADCNLLPKLHVIRVAGKLRKNWDLPEEFTGIQRYLDHADNQEEFKETCPDNDEIDFTYGGRGKKPRGSVLGRNSSVSLWQK